MKAVVLKIGVLILIHLMTSCQKAILDSKKNKSIIIKQQVSDSDSIITNSLKPGFDGDLINKQKVQKGDTILFREWGNNTEINKTTIYSNNTKFEVVGDSVLKYYKTGQNRFSTYKIRILNKKNNKAFQVYGCVNYDNYTNDVYDDNLTFPSAGIKKVSNNLGRLVLYCQGLDECHLYFKIKNNEMHIIKISSLSHFYSEQFKYKLDTLIILKNNSFIYPDSLRSKVCKEKNRIPVKDSRK